MHVEYSRTVIFFRRDPLMKTRRRLSLALLIYWGLLINLGPSLHTLSFLGLHDSSCCSSLTCLDLPQLKDDLHSGCCCSSHSEPSSQDSDEVDGQIDAVHDCSFCKFFKHYQADSVQSVDFEPSERVDTFCLRSGLASSLEVISSRARGPPATLQFC